MLCVMDKQTPNTSTLGLQSYIIHVQFHYMQEILVATNFSEKDHLLNLLKLIAH